MRCSSSHGKENSPKDADGHDSSEEGFVKLKKNKTLFTKKEDEKLIKLVKFFGKKRNVNWQFVSQQMGNRSVRQCKERYSNYLDDRVNRSEFTPEENLFILQKVDEIGKKWARISSLMNKRSEVGVKSQYKKLMRRHATIENVLTLDVDSHPGRRKLSEISEKESIQSAVKVDDQVFNELFGELEFDESKLFEISMI